jgi:hypothetical protein
MADPNTSEPTSTVTGAAPTGDAAAPVLKWYIVNTYSGHENKAKLTLLERVANAGLGEFFGEVLVPTESVMETIKGQRRTMTRKMMPGYMFVQMMLDDRTFTLVKNTPKITGFLGGMKPTPVPEKEITGSRPRPAMARPSRRPRWSTRWARTCGSSRVRSPTTLAPSRK